MLEMELWDLGGETQLLEIIQNTGWGIWAADL